jgi:hypothetical protein
MVHVLAGGKVHGMKGGNRSTGVTRTTRIHVTSRFGRGIVVEYRANGTNSGRTRCQMPRCSGITQLLYSIAQKNE